MRQCVEEREREKAHFSFGRVIKREREGGGGRRGNVSESMLLDW